ncbi:MAG TPA: serine/threonine-protein kinase [Planctomycetota bacterium]
MPRSELCDDPLLRDAPIIEGFKVLDPAVLYAKVGAGGMGAVYRAIHLQFGIDVAVKVLKPPPIADDPTFVKRFEREARTAASISHQNVVSIKHAQVKHGLHYIVMEFVLGHSAGERLRERGPLSERDALAILHGACAGLAEAHARGIVHRDIKPDNILIAHDGRVKVADLGLAKSTYHLDGRTMSMDVSRVMGTAPFMAPEQWDTMDVTAAADVWALGATFYSLVTGRAGAGTGSAYTIAKRIKEADYPSLRDVRPDLRPEVHAMFERCVQREPAQRFADAKELLRDLRGLAPEDEGVLDDWPTGTWTVPRAEPVTRETLRRIRAEIETKAIDRRAERRPAGEPVPDSPPASELPTVPQVVAPDARPRPEPADKPRRTRKRRRLARSKPPTTAPHENLLSGVAAVVPVAPVGEGTTPQQVAATVQQPPATPAKSSWAWWLPAALVVIAVLVAGYEDGWFTANANGTGGTKTNETGSRLKIGVADTTPPVIEWLAPDASKPVRAGEVEVRGTVTDASRVKSVTVNGRPASLVGAMWTGMVKVEAAKPGMKLVPVVRVSVVATDEAGNASKPLERLLSVLPAASGK